jgi:hypothetical protein
MPYSYTNPGWVNGNIPAINATNLNNISNLLAGLGAAFDNGGDPAYLFGGSAALQAAWATILEAAPGAGWATALAASATTGSANLIDSNTVGGTGIANITKHNTSGAWSSPGCGASTTAAIPAGNIVQACITQVSGADTNVIQVQWFDGATWQVIASANRAFSSSVASASAVCVQSTGSNYRFFNGTINACNTFLLVW